MSTAALKTLRDALLVEYVRPPVGDPAAALRPVAEAGRRLGVPLIVDNSLAPLSLRPVAEGAAVVVYDAAGPLGAGSADGGIIIDGGSFPWDAHPRQLPSLSRPDPSYHGIVWTEVVRQWKVSPFVASVRGRFLRDFGAAISPCDVTQLIQAVETLPLRVRHRTDNAVRLVGALAAHPAITALHGPVGGRLALLLREEMAVPRVLSRLRLVGATAEYGGSRSTAWQERAGAIGIAIGLEHADDLVGDLWHALESES